MTPARRTLSLVLLAILLSGPGPVARAAAPEAQFPDVPNVASYTIDVSLDAEARLLTGREVVTYVNTSDRPIPNLVFHFYLNAFSSPDTLFM